MKPIDPERLYKLVEVANCLSLHSETIRKYVKLGVIPTTKIKIDSYPFKCLAVLGSDLQKFKESRED